MFLVFLTLLAVASAQKVTVDPHFNYHEAIGIPLATSIKAAEDALFAGERLNDTDDEVRIAGGVASAINSHPYLAGLVVSFSNTPGRSGCGSTLLTANRLVTAGHCWFDGVNRGSSFEVVMGSQYLFYGGTRITTSQVYTHPEYNALVSNIRNDVAMIYLPTNVALNANIQPVALPSTTMLNNDFVGTWATAVGYGKTSDLEPSLSTSTFRREVNVQVMSLAQCQSTYGANVVLSSNICTNGAGLVGVCGGDSGGPLTAVVNGQRILIGVTSFAAYEACHHGHPSAFARVTSFYNFIVQHL